MRSGAWVDSAYSRTEDALSRALSVSFVDATWDTKVLEEIGIPKSHRMGSPGLNFPV